MNPARAILPARRYGDSFDVVHETPVGLVRYRLQVNEFPDGRLGEIFINSGKPNSSQDANAGDVAILLSLLLQHGIDPVEIGHALRRNPDGSRASVAGVAADALAALDRGELPAAGAR